MSEIWLVAAASLVLALAVGGNNSAASMGAAYGAGIRTKRQALLIIVVFFAIGAVVGGLPVANSIAGNYMDGRRLAGNSAMTLLIISVSAFFITLTNLIRVPISTALATIFALVGAGLYTSTLNVSFFAASAMWWVLAPLGALMCGYVFSKYIHPKALEWIANLGTEKEIDRILRWTITGTGCYIAFSIGANSVGKAMGPAVGFGLDTFPALVLGGVGMGAGALLMGFGVIQTVGKRIAEICVIRAGGVELISGTFIILAASLGFPISVTHTTTSAVIGLNCGKKGFREALKAKVTSRIIVAWLTVPLLATVLTYALLSLILGAPR